jgi:hypothetical protein
MALARMDPRRCRRASMMTKDTRDIQAVLGHFRIAITADA